MNNLKKIRKRKNLYSIELYNCEVCGSSQFGDGMIQCPSCGRIVCAGIEECWDKRTGTCTICSSEIFQKLDKAKELTSQLTSVTRRARRLEKKKQELSLQLKSIKEKQKSMPVKKSIALSKNIFIVHGRDHKPMKELKAMLTMFSLNPIVLHEQPSGSRTIVEKLEKYSDVGYAFVILTPDDIGGFLGKMTYINARVFKPRARQNVVLEFGYFIGLLSRDRVCCLYKGDVELPSDMHGIVYMPFKESVNEVKDKIMKELKEAGYKDLYPPPVPPP